MYELVPSRDLKFLLPGDSLTVFSHKSFPEQFEFTMHYVDKHSGELKSVVAPHQSRLRAHLSVARPPGPLRGSVSGPYNQVTFTAPSTGKISFSGFSGSFFKKAGVLELLPELTTVEVPASRALTPDHSPLPSPASTTNILKKRSSAPSTPTLGSPRNGASSQVAGGSDEIVSSAHHAAFFSSPHLSSAFSTSELNSSSAGAFFATSGSASSATKALNKPVKRLMPVALSFRTKITSNGVETIYNSPLFVLCETVDQVDLKVCRVFRHAMLETYPAPPSAADDALPAPRVSASSKKALRSEKVDAKAEKVDPKAEKTEKSEKTTSKSKRSKSPPANAAANAAGKPEPQFTGKQEASAVTNTDTNTTTTTTGLQRKLSNAHTSATTTPTTPTAVNTTSTSSTTYVPTAPISIQGRCKVEATREESSRFQALKFW